MDVCTISRQSPAYCVGGVWEMIKIALAGNPNCGKTTLFNVLTGSNQYVGNWPGVTVEKKEGRLKSDKEVIVTDLPGIYSLSPYTLEEVVARSYLLTESPDVILNIIDGTNLERNLYLTMQLLEMGIPVVAAVNMMDAVEKSGDKIDIGRLGEVLGCPVVPISALKSSGMETAVTLAVEAAGKPICPFRCFSEATENALEQIERLLPSALPEKYRRFYAVKLFERDKKILSQMDGLSDLEDIICDRERREGDDSESIITNERYAYISSVIDGCYIKRTDAGASVSDKIDAVLTNRVLALPIFAVIMFAVYYIAVTTVGGMATDWANDGLFGKGWHLFGVGTSAYEQADQAYEAQVEQARAFLAAAEKNGIETGAVREAMKAGKTGGGEISDFIRTARENGVTAVLQGEDGRTRTVNAEEFSSAVSAAQPDPAAYGIWVPGIPVLLENALEKINCAQWLQSLILDGIVAGVGSVLGFVPQLIVLFVFLAFLESCGYMARVAFIMDRIFRKFGLSGKSFIPMLIGTGCSVPGIMASRTIENDHDRKMTVITTSFIPCGAKLPIIALISGALFGGAWWVAPSAYFVGILAVLLSGVLLKKTSRFSGEDAPFVMELPAYHMPTVSAVLRSTWERSWSFIKKAGTVILLSSIVIWAVSNLGVANGRIVLVDDLKDGFLAAIGGWIAWIFAPLGWGSWQGAVSAITGLVAKENVVSTFGVLFGFAQAAENSGEMRQVFAQHFTAASAYSFLIFNLLCAPCVAAMGAIRREMNSARWTWFALGYQTGFAYAVSLCIYQIWNWIVTGSFGFWTGAALVVIAVFFYLLMRRPKRDAAKPVSEKKDMEEMVC